MTRGKGQPEAQVIGKVLDFINNLFPHELKRATKEFRTTQEAKIVSDEAAYYRGLLSYFLIQRTINGATPMEYAISFPLGFFTKKDKRIIANFVGHIESLFVVKQISNGRKDFLLQDITNHKEYLVKTIDFPDLLKEGDIISALIVKKVEGTYFFYSNVLTYDTENALKMKKWLIRKRNEIQKRMVPEIDWEIIYAKNRKS